MEIIQCPKCPADYPAAYAARHAAIHARQERNHTEAVAADAAVTAAYGPARKAAAR